MTATVRPRRGSVTQASALRIARALGRLALQQRLSALETLGTPELLAVVILVDGDGARRQNDPRLLRARVDVDVGRQPIRLVQRADTDEAHGVAAAAIVAPDGDAASRAARDLLSGAALRWRHDDLGLTREDDDAVGLDQGVERERRARLALAPAAVAAVHDQRRARHPIANRAAGAAALEGEASWIIRHDLSSVGKVPARFTSGMLARLLAPLAVPELHALPLLHPLDR